MLSRAKVRVALKAHWCLLSVRVDASVVTTPSLPSPLCYHAGVVRESSTAVPPGIHTTSRSTRGPIDPYVPPSLRHLSVCLLDPRTGARAAPSSSASYWCTSGKPTGHIDLDKKPELRDALELLEEAKRLGLPSAIEEVRFCPQCVHVCACLQARVFVNSVLFWFAVERGLTESISECIYQGPCGLYALCASVHPSCSVCQALLVFTSRTNAMVMVTSRLPPTPSRPVPGVLSRGVCGGRGRGD